MYLFINQLIYSDNINHKQVNKEKKKIINLKKKKLRNIKKYFVLNIKRIFSIFCFLYFFI